jgi:lysophospholipase L1-like esterase
MPVVNLGFSGISTSQGLGQLPRVLDHDPQVVVIELGGHDFLKGKSRTATKKNLEKMIEACRETSVNASPVD